MLNIDYLSLERRQQTQKFPSKESPSRAEILRKFISDLKFGNEQAKISAIKELAKMNELEMTAVIARQLNNQSQSVRQEAAKTLAVLGAKECIPALLSGLESPDPKTAVVIIEAIICLDQDKTEAVLKKCLLHGDPKVCIAAVEYIKDNHVKQVTDQLMDLLEDSDASVRIAACQALGQLKVQESIRAVCGMLKAEDPAERKAAITALGKIGCKDAVPYLAGRLDKVEVDEYTDILKALVKIGHKSAVPYLMQGLNAEEANIRLIVVKGLGQFFDEETAITLVETALVDDEDVIRGAAVSALKGCDVKIIGDILISQLENEDQEIRMRSIQLLGEFPVTVDMSYLGEIFETASLVEQGLILEALGKGKNSSNTQLVLRALSRKERVLKERAIDALSRIMGQEAGPYLEPLLEDDDRRVRFKAALELVSLGNIRAAEILIEALKDEYIETRDLAEKALIGFKNKNIIPELSVVFKDENYRFRYFATVSSQDKYGKKEAIPRLKKDLKAEDLWIRYAALKALYFFKDPAAQDDLRAVLEQGDLLSRVMAARTLGTIGAQTKSAEIISLLNSCLADESREVRCAVMESLGMIKHD
ncbi:MAG: HEAT repeat domain-containing protein, partial [Candidatus Omnitrophica bacterium]|nr:HEAT repeat domain-containing protein [Candidatus Omnitrophota bacterium]